MLTKGIWGLTTWSEASSTPWVNSKVGKTRLGVTLWEHISSSWYQTDSSKFGENTLTRLPHCNISTYSWYLTDNSKFVQIHFGDYLMAK